MKELVRDIFSRFQNLNLLALMANLRSMMVARNACRSMSISCSEKIMCPLWHGRRGGRAMLTEDLKEVMAREIGVHYEQAQAFIMNWDSCNITDQQLYLCLLQIWQERMQDAEAVQGVLHTPEYASKQYEVCV